MTAGLLGWHIKDAYTHHRFQTSIDRFVIQMHQLQTVALSYQSDLGIELRQNGKGVVCQIVTDDRIKGIDSTKIISLPGIDHFTYKDKQPAKLRLKIYSYGGIDPAGILVFHENEEIKLWVDLRQPLKVAISTQEPKKLLDPIPHENL